MRPYRGAIPVRDVRDIQTPEDPPIIIAEEGRRAGDSEDPQLAEPMA